MVCESDMRANSLFNFYLLSLSRVLQLFRRALDHNLGRNTLNIEEFVEIVVPISRCGILELWLRSLLTICLRRSPTILIIEERRCSGEVTRDRGGRPTVFIGSFILKLGFDATYYRPMLNRECVSTLNILLLVWRAWNCSWILLELLAMRDDLLCVVLEIFCRAHANLRELQAFYRHLVIRNFDSSI